jgi:hypothetical protein
MNRRYATWTRNGSIFSMNSRQWKIIPVVNGMLSKVSWEAKEDFGVGPAPPPELYCFVLIMALLFGLKMMFLAPKWAVQEKTHHRQYTTPTVLERIFSMAKLTL